MRASKEIRRQSLNLILRNEQVYRAQSGREGHGLHIDLRSDLEDLPGIPVQVRVPTVWLLGSSTAATWRLMAGISQPPPQSKESHSSNVTPAEVLVDGVKWCNLLAAPVTTPSLALTALTYALPPNPNKDANSLKERNGPIRMANHFIEVSCSLSQELPLSVLSQPFQSGPIHSCSISCKRDFMVKSSDLAIA